MRNALLLTFCLLPTIAASDERTLAPEGAARIALAPASGASRESPTAPLDSAACSAEMDPQSLRELVQTEARRAGIDE